MAQEGQKTLRDELIQIEASGWNFATLNYPHEGKEFVSEDGFVRDKTEAELSEGQRKFLAVIRQYYRRWLVDHDKPLP